MFDAQAIIAEATAEASKAETNATEQELQANPEETQASETQETNQETDDVSKKPDSELTPEQLEKREANRQSHLNRKLAKQRLREENLQLKAKLSELEQKYTAPKVESAPSDYPKEENYESIIDYMKAVAKYEAKQEYQAANKSETQASAENPLRTQAITKIKTFVESNPEYAALERQNLQTLQTIPEDIQQAFFKTENPQLALYALMKEDSLDDLYDIAPEDLRYFIGRAEERGKSYLSPVKRATSASAPIEALKGTGRATKDLNSMSIPELMKKFNR